MPIQRLGPTFEEMTVQQISEAPLFSSAELETAQVKKPIIKKVVDNNTYKAQEMMETFWKYRKSILNGEEWEKYTIKYAKIRKKRIKEDYNEGIKQGQLQVQLSSISYQLGDLPNKDGFYPAGFAKKDVRDRWILKTDLLETLEGDFIDCRNIPTYFLMCDDTHGRYTRFFRNVNFEGYQKCLHYFTDVKTVYYRGEHYETHYAKTLGIKVCEDCGRCSTIGHDCTCNSPEIDGYHSTRDEMFANNSQDAKIRVGLEIEKPTCVDGETNIKMKKKQWRCETDSSAGYEYITPILSIDNIEECIDWVTTTGGDILNAPANTRCGGHIHISVKGEYSGETYNRIKGWRPLLWALYPERCDTNYANRNNSNMSHSVDVGLRTNTVEVRIFPGLDSEKKLRFRLSLLKYFIENPQPTTEGAMEQIVNDESLQDILDIAYGENHIRRHKLFNRIKEFYGVSSSDGEMNGKVASIVAKFVTVKIKGKTREERNEIERIVVTA